MGKKFSGASQTMSRFRGWIQAGATLLTTPDGTAALLGETAALNYTVPTKRIV